MFLFETAALFVVALVCMALLLFAFREYVADMAASCDHDLGYIHFVRLATGPFVQRYPGYSSIPGIYFG